MIVPKRKKLVLVALIAISTVLLSGCGVRLPVQLPFLPWRHASPTPTWTPAAAPTAAAAPTPTAAPTATPEPTSTPVPTSTPTPTATSTPRPTSTPTRTPTPTATPTPAVSVLRDMNLRAGPGTVYPVVGHARKGQVLPVVARWGKWYQVAEGKWIYGGKGLAEPNAGAKAVQAAKKIPPTPTPRPTPTPKPKPTTPPSSNLPPMQDVVVLGPNTRYPVRARVFRGWGYEIVDKSAKWDVVMYRDVYGFVAHQVFKWVYDSYPHGIRITLIDAKWKEGCPPPNGPAAPILLNQWGSGGWYDRCYHDMLTIDFGDGEGGLLYADCTNKNMGVYTDPLECFIAVASPGPYLSDIGVSATVVAVRSLTGLYSERTPDFTQNPYTPNLGKATRNPKTGQWRWTNPFLKIVPAAP